MPDDISPATPVPPLDRERDRAHPLQIELYRRATATEKLAVVGRLNASALRLKAASLEKQFPSLGPERRRELLRRWWLTARD